MKIKGLQKLTLLDFPGEIACTVFLGGCNFRCPFCHNASIVLPEREAENISVESFLEFLDSRRGKLSGVCVSGGEPTLSADLPNFLREIKSRGLRVKLDTNGYLPGVLESLIDEGLVDYVAMDIKNSMERYGETVGIDRFNVSPIDRSARLLMTGRVDFEFRTTVTVELHDADSIRAIGEWLRGDESFYLQTFLDSGDLLSCGLSPYSKEEMESLTAILREYIPRAELR
ncbi:MAG: anaerobic ribonucleoside-triphosphate reductase activating protein [Clostridia bacterium]|nr:anaerobic ribonucleoside-triphosphate reductase activating protein [Clostridia bacterium]